MKAGHLPLPPVASAVCRECPWRRTAAPGHLGPFTAEEWKGQAHGEDPIACHLTINGEGEGWLQDGLRQCRGAAIYRCNVVKTPRNPTDARHQVTADRQLVFASPMEFLAHHRGES